MTPLPIDSVLTDLINALRPCASVVLRAPAGAGKTTRVPPALLDCGLVTKGQVLVLQPRRVAARAVARRIAEERGGRLGDEVGYHIRFDRQFARQTRLIVMTEGVLVRRLQDDPFLDGVAAIIFDEFHERHLETDVSLAMSRRIQQTVRPDLKLIVMSATLAAEPIARYLGGCPVVELEVPAFPVEILYEAMPAATPMSVQVVRGVDQALQQTTGDVLVFLPGVREIRDAQHELSGLVTECDLAVFPLYGELPAEEQDRVFAPCARRRVVLATNVAETSITIPGITAVVDTGMARILEFDANLGLNRLELRPISKAAADQRSGRAGRTCPGLCLRLWSEVSHRHRLDREIAEIHRVDLSGVLLQLLDWGETDVMTFPWFKLPEAAAIERARGLLVRLGACDEQGITALGRQMVRLAIAPRLARLLIEGARSGELRRAALAAALLSERDPFLRGDRSRQASHRSQSDVLDRIDALAEFSQSRRTQFDVGTLQRGAAEFVLKSAEQFERQVRDLLPPDEKLSGDRQAAAGDGVLRALLAAFPDRLAKRREVNGRRGVMVGGRGVKLADSSAVTEGELFVCVDADAGGTESFVRQASVVDRSWLPVERVVIRTDIEFDSATERVQARRRTCWDDLILEESPASLPEGDETAAVLARAAADAWPRVLPTDNSGLTSFLARVRCLREWMPELELPRFDDDWLKMLLPELCQGCRSFAELRAAPWVPLLQSKLQPQQFQALEREAPERIAVPSGSRLPIHYEPGRPPVLAVRIQEVFGWRTTPRIAAGRVPLLLHLLAPNHRPQQITDDLTSFWTNAYPIIRGELKRRYPKHAWPEDPWNAQPERRPQPRKSR